MLEGIERFSGRDAMLVIAGSGGESAQKIPPRISELLEYAKVSYFLYPCSGSLGTSEVLKGAELARKTKRDVIIGLDDGAAAAQSMAFATAMLPACGSRNPKTALPCLSIYSDAIPENELEKRRMKA